MAKRHGELAAIEIHGHHFLSVRGASAAQCCRRYRKKKKMINKYVTRHSEIIGTRYRPTLARNKRKALPLSWDARYLCVTFLNCELTRATLTLQVWVRAIYFKKQRVHPKTEHNYLFLRFHRDSGEKKRKEPNVSLHVAWRIKTHTKKIEV